MKRGAPTNQRKKTNSNDISAPHGVLTETEIEDIRQAYIDGCTGGLMIGLNGEQRLLTTLLPPQSDADSATRQIRQVAAGIRKVGCDGYIYVRRVRLSANTEAPVIVLVVDEHTTASYRQVIRPIQPDTHLDLQRSLETNDLPARTLATEWDAEPVPSLSGD